MMFRSFIPRIYCEYDTFPSAKRHDTKIDRSGEISSLIQIDTLCLRCHVNFLFVARREEAIVLVMLVRLSYDFLRIYYFLVLVLCIDAPPQFLITVHCLATY